MKAPYWFVAEGSKFRLQERGEPTNVTYSSIASAKADVLARNDEWRKDHPKKAKPAAKAKKAKK